VAIPRQATTSPARKTVEHSCGSRQLVKWQTGCEGRISYLKRGYGWDRTLLDGKTEPPAPHAERGSPHNGHLATSARQLVTG
jgi:hypothetical protein